MDSTDRQERYLTEVKRLGQLNDECERKIGATFATLGELDRAGELTESAITTLLNMGLPTKEEYGEFNFRLKERRDHEPNFLTYGGERDLRRAAVVEMMMGAVVDNSEAKMAAEILNQFKLGHHILEKSNEAEKSNWIAPKGIFEFLSPVARISHLPNNLNEFLNLLIPIFALSNDQYGNYSPTRMRELAPRLIGSKTDVSSNTLESLCKPEIGIIQRLNLMEEQMGQREREGYGGDVSAMKAVVS